MSTPTRPARDDGAVLEAHERDGDGDRLAREQVHARLARRGEEHATPDDADVERSAARAGCGWIETAVRLASDSVPSRLIASSGPLTAFSGTSTSTLFMRARVTGATMSSAGPRTPRKTSLRTSRIVVPRTRSRLPGWTASIEAHRATHESAPITAGSEAPAPPVPALAGADAPSEETEPAQHCDERSFQLDQPPLCAAYGVS